MAYAESHDQVLILQLHCNLAVSPGIHLVNVLSALI